MLTFIASQVTFPPLIPFIIYLSVKVGAPFVSNRASFENASFDLDFIKQNLIQYVIGSFLLATLSALFFGAVSYFFYIILALKKSADFQTYNCLKTNNSTGKSLEFSAKIHYIRTLEI
ncbi:DUF2062 domain-containing protein [Chryseobacterium taklimakanense]|nr:DUF2062 domain-containing protein [Chryseobacterium taklimakanense]